MNRKTLVAMSVIAAASLVLLGCNAQSADTVSTNTSTAASSSTSTPPAAPANDACTLVSAADIKAQANLDVDAGVTTSSGSCKYSHGSEFVLLQVLANSYDSVYNPSLWTGITELSDVGEKAFVQTPDSGNANAQAVKNGQVVYYTFYTQQALTVDQEKALLKFTIDKI